MLSDITPVATLPTADMAKSPRLLRGDARFDAAARRHGWCDLRMR